MRTACGELHLALLPQVESVLDDGTIYVFSLVKRSHRFSNSPEPKELYQHLCKFLTEKMEVWKNDVAFYRFTPAFVRTKPL